LPVCCPSKLNCGQSVAPARDGRTVSIADKPSQAVTTVLISTNHSLPQTQHGWSKSHRQELGPSTVSRQFDRLYSKVGRPSIPRDRLLRTLLLQYLYGIRSEWLLMEQLRLANREHDDLTPDPAQEPTVIDALRMC